MTARAERDAADYVNRYRATNQRIPAGLRVRFLDYDKRLNRPEGDLPATASRILASDRLSRRCALLQPARVVTSYFTIAPGLSLGPQSRSHLASRVIAVFWPSDSDATSA